MSGGSRPRRRLAFEAVDSTNTRALEAARAGDPGPLWITAERQTGGKGRRGRDWVSPVGNLYASLLLIEPSPLDHLSNLPLVAAVGVRDGLAWVAGLRTSDLRIKWPNDLLIGRAKCVGILIESERLAGGGNAVVIGCGVNVEWAPEGASYLVTSLRREGATAGLGEIFEALAGGVEAAIRRWDRGRGFAAIRAEWLDHAAGIGEACTVNLADRSVSGRFLELDERGRLVLLLKDGSRQTHSAGDLFLLGAPSRSPEARIA